MNVVETSANSYWVGLARAYAEARPPLRPSGEDVQFYEKTVAAHARVHPNAIQALLFGITPDIASMRWPAPCSLLAIDSSGAMAKAVWPGDVPGTRWAVCGDWLVLPRHDSSCDVAIGDGSMNCLRYPHDCRAFAKSVRAALKPEGIFILRCYAQPEVPEPPDQVFDDALRGKIPTFTQFKFRLLMSMQRSAREGVAVDRVYRFWTDCKPAEPALIARTGWRKAEIDTMELYRDAVTVHTFPTLAESRAVLSEFFDETSVSFPSYYCGERCPRLVLTARRGGD